MAGWIANWRVRHQHPASRILHAVGIPLLPSAGVLIVALTALAYLPAVRGTFIWDDDVYVTNNPSLRDVDGLRRIWFEPGGLKTQYYPLTLTTLWAEYQAFGLDPLGYHVTNLALHAAGAALFFLVLSRLGIPGALFAALLFVIHPMQVESVAWVTQRKNLLCGLWVMLTLLAWLRFLKRRSAGAYAAALACFVAALLSKSAALPLPAVLALSAWGLSRPTLRRDLFAALPFAIIAVGMGLVTVWVERSHGVAGGFGRNITWPESCVIAGRALWFYPLKFVGPVNLMSIYPRWPIDAARIWQYGLGLAAAALVVGLWWGRRRFGRWPLVAVLTYMALIAPVLSFVDFGFLGHSFVADHFFYLPSIGLAALFGGLAAAIVRRWGVAGRWIGWTGGLAIVAALAVLTWRQGGIYRDTEKFWGYNVDRHPTHTAYHNLAEISWQRGDAGRTIELELASISAEDNARARYRLATVYDRLGRTDEALKEFERALELNRRRERLDDIERNTLFNIGSLHWLKKDGEKAAEYWEAALRVDPDWAVAKEWLAKVKPP